MPKENRYEIKALAGERPVLYIYGDIGEDFWAEESNDAKSLVPKIAAINAPEIDVRLFSYGGSVADALAIFNALDRHPAKIFTYNDGVCMSAMSLIYMVGDVRYAAENALLMIHAPITGTYGNAMEHRESADRLDRFADAMLTSYMRSGQTREQVEPLVKDGADHYFTAEEALSSGFATEITEAVAIAASAVKQDRFSLPAAWVAANHLNREEIKMPKEQTPTATNTDPVVATTTDPAVKDPKTTETDPKVQAKSPTEVLAAEKVRRQNVRAAFEPFKDREGVQAILDKVLDDPTVDVSAASDRLLKHLGSEGGPLAGNPKITVGATEGEKYVEAATNAILARSGNAQRDRANPFNGSTLMDLARASLDMAGISHRGMDKREVVGAAFTHSTSDFPVLLENVMHKSLLAAYAKAQDTWTRFCKTGDLSDFRAHNRYRTGSFGNLDKKTENNEFKFKTLDDAVKQSISLDTKGNIIGISREMIINDDLGVFLDLVQQMGRAAKRTVESDVYALLASNPVMADGKALFHADHGNLASSGSVPTMLAIEAGRVAMAQQKDISGNDFLDIRPSIFLGGMGTGGQARSINRSEYDPDTANKLQKPNMVLGLFSDVVDSPRITGNEWYEFADPADAPVIEVGFLDGNQEPYLEMKEGFTQDGAMYKVRLDYGLAAIGYEGAYKNPGAAP